MNDKTAAMSLTSAHLRQLKVASQSNRRDAAEIAVSIKNFSRQQRNDLFGADLWWAWVYELSMMQHLMLWFIAFDLTAELKRVLDGAGDKVQALLNFANDFEPSDEATKKIFGPEADEIDKALASSLFLGILRQIECVEQKGCYLSDLVAKVASGKDIGDVAFFNALHIDRTVVSCSTFGLRIARAELEDDAEFFKGLANNLKKRWKKTSPKKTEKHKDLRMMLQLTHETGMLESMSMKEADKLFIEELRVYLDESEDPARGLQRFILRWRNKR
jgi:hypothetical protein